MSTISSSLNSLSSATTMDLYAPLARRTEDAVHLLRAGRLFTIGWGVVLIGGAILFQFASQGTPVVVIALQIASFTYGGLLGAFLLGIAFPATDQRDVVTGMSVAIVTVASLWASQQFGAIPVLVDGLWFSLLGSAITLAVGLASRRLRSTG